MTNFNNSYYPYGTMYQQPYVQQSNQQSYANNMYQQPSATYQQQQQTSYLPLTFTSGLIGVKAFIVAPNQTVYLRDSDEGSNLLFEKSADMYGKYTIKAYRLNEVNIDDIGKPIEKTNISESVSASYLTKDDFKDFKTLFEKKMDDLSYLVQKNSKNYKNNVNTKDSDKNE